MSLRSSNTRRYSWTHGLLGFVTACILAGASGSPAGATTGITDWLIATDYSTIQDAINKTPANGTVYIPKGRYRLTKSLYLPNDRAIRVLGAGPERTVLNWTSDPGGDSAYFVVRFHYQTIEGLQIIGSDKTNHHRGIFLDPRDLPEKGEKRLTNFHAKELQLSKIPYWGMEAFGLLSPGGNQFTLNCRAEDCIFVDNKSGGAIKLGPSSTGWTIRGCGVGSATGYMLYLDKASLVNIQDSGFGDPADNTPMVYIKNCLSVEISRCDLEAGTSTGYFVKFEGMSNGIHLMNNHFVRNHNYVRMVQCTSPDMVLGLVVVNPSVYLPVTEPADSNRTDDIVVDSPSTVTVMGGTLCDNGACERPFKLSGTATKVTTVNYNPWLRLPKLTNVERDQIKLKTAGDMVFNTDRVDVFDGARWREQVAFFPGGATATAAPAGIDLPTITSAQRDSIPTAFKVKGALIYNSDTNKLNFWNGSAWRVVTDGP